MLNAMERLDCLPKPYLWYEHQIAGHHPSVIKNGLRQIGIIKEPHTRYLLKVAQDGTRGICEEELYSDVTEAHRNKRTDLPVFYDLYHLIPRYYGTQDIVIGKRKKVHKFLKLEDIICTYSQPCVMDIKIGRVSYDPSASQEKRVAELKKCPFQQECGFRILGYRITADDPNLTKTKGREWGRDQNKETIDDAFIEFLNGRSKDTDRLAAEFLRRLHIVKEYFDNQRSLQFYASSLLFVYEGDTSKKPSVDLRMIDFSHVFRVPNVKDENYLMGLNYMCAVFERLLHESILP